MFKNAHVIILLYAFKYYLIIVQKEKKFNKH